MGRGMPGRERRLGARESHGAEAGGDTGHGAGRQGSTVWREGGCSQSRFWGQWWGSGSRFVTEEPPKPEAIRQGGRWKGEGAAGFFLVAVCRMGTANIGQQPLGSSGCSPQTAALHSVLGSSQPLLYSQCL